MKSAAPKAASAVTVLVSRRVKPGREAAFEQASEAMTAAARPRLPRVMVITMLVVLFMTLVAPRLTTWLKSFLYPLSCHPN